MIDHRHHTYVDGCYRCELSRDEVQSDRLVELVGEILVTIDAANDKNCDTIASKLIERLQQAGVTVAI